MNKITPGMGNLGFVGEGDSNQHNIPKSRTLQLGPPGGPSISLPHPTGILDSMPAILIQYSASFLSFEDKSKLAVVSLIFNANLKIIINSEIPLLKSFTVFNTIQLRKLAELVKPNAPLASLTIVANREFSRLSSEDENNVITIIVKAKSLTHFDYPEVTTKMLEVLAIHCKELSYINLGGFNAYPPLENLFTNCPSIETVRWIPPPNEDDVGTSKLYSRIMFRMWYRMSYGSSIAGFC